MRMSRTTKRVSDLSCSARPIRQTYSAQTTIQQYYCSHTIVGGKGHRLPVTPSLPALGFPEPPFPAGGILEGALYLQVFVIEIEQKLVTAFIFGFDFFVFQVGSCCHPSMDLGWKPLKYVWNLEFFLIFIYCILILIF